jgi:hydrogenase/urease accessory protein HupE
MIEVIGGLWRKWMLVCLGMMAFTASAGGHPIKQVRAELRAAEGIWNATLWLEGWVLYPKDGPKAPPGNPGDLGMSGKAWVDGLDASDHRAMREAAEALLAKAFVLTLGGQRLEAKSAFPDYTVERPQLEENEEGNAVVRVDLTGSLPPGVAGPLEVVWNDDEEEPLAIKVITPREGKNPKVSLLRIAPRDEPMELVVIEASGVVAPTKESSLGGWIVAGFEHILPKGLDHILFILGLFLLQPKWKPLLWQSSAFTVAHSITLALAILGIVTAPAEVVEPLIALSIAYVGIENLWVKELKPWRIALVFGLGLLHGMGFASVMQDLDLPEGEILQPLVGFNIGVELGQITVLALAFGLTFWFMKKSAFETFRKVVSGLIGIVGLYWTVERIWF